MNNFEKRFYTYVLFSLLDRGLYIGYTTDLKNRFSEHIQGRVRSTKNRLPLILVHYEFFINIADAKAREEFMKSSYGRKQLQDILKKTLLSIESDLNKYCSINDFLNRLDKTSFYSKLDHAHTS